MQETGQTTPEVQLKAEALINTGYQLLLTYEHTGGGFSWFGEPGDPYLTVTALGLMEFSDMAEVFPIDPNLIPRTRDWLIGKQEADGSWKGDISEFFSFQTSTLRNSAFVVWSLATSGATGAAVDKGVSYLVSELDKGEADAYTLATAANALAMAAPNHPATAKVLATLDGMKKTEGDFVYWDTGGTQTSFYGYGDSAAIEATALVTHAMLMSGGYKPSVDGAIKFLLSKKDANGNFGSTQSTIWTLRTLIVAASKGGEGAVGVATVLVDGQQQAEVQLFADQWDVMQTVDLANLATTGDHKVSLSFAGTGKMSYNLVAKHNVPWAMADPEPPGPLSIAVSYDKTTIEVNDTVAATMVVTNNTEATLNMVLVTLGIPPGFVVETGDLAPYIEQGVLTKFETTAKQLTLYIFELAPLAQQELTYRLRATMPVKASDGGAAAYPYYEPDKRTTAESTQLEATD
jgi:hypothetical protein